MKMNYAFTATHQSHLWVTLLLLLFFIIRLFNTRYFLPSVSFSRIHCYSCSCCCCTDCLFHCDNCNCSSSLHRLRDDTCYTTPGYDLQVKYSLSLSSLCPCLTVPTPPAKTCFFDHLTATAISTAQVATLPSLYCIVSCLLHHQHHPRCPLSTLL